MPHPHDYGYKELFTHPQILKELLVSCVHEHWVADLDFSKATLVDKSFITTSRKKLESDLIWRIPLNSGVEVYLYILMECQSTVDRFMALRMLRYILELYGNLLKEVPKTKLLPPVFPVLLYNGDGRWTAPENMAELIDCRINMDYMPQFRYFKIAENELSQESLLAMRNIIGALFLVDTSDRERLAPLVRELVDLFKEEQPEVYKPFVRWLYSHFADPVPEWVTEISQLTEVPTLLATTIKKWEKDLIQEGLHKGKLERKREGKLEGKREIARNLKRKGLSLTEIAEVTGLSVEEILTLRLL